MIIQPFVFEVGPLEANLFLAADRPGGEGFLVDAGAFDESVLACARELRLSVKTILLTHLHHDHVDGAAAYASSLCRDRGGFAILQVVSPYGVATENRIEEEAI